MEADKKTDEEHLASDPCVFCSKTSKEIKRFVTGYTVSFAALIVGYCGFVAWMSSRL